MNMIGIVQGRVSPSVNGVIQAFPKDTWGDEFQVVSSLLPHLLVFLVPFYCTNKFCLSISVNS